MLEGFSHDFVLYDSNKRKWVIVDDTKEKVWGIYKPKFSTSPPKGLGGWTLFDSYCNETRNLKLSSVSSNLTTI